MTLQEVIAKLKSAEQDPFRMATPEQQAEHDYITALNANTAVWMDYLDTQPSQEEITAFAEGFFYAWHFHDSQ